MRVIEGAESTSGIPDLVEDRMRYPRRIGAASVLAVTALAAGTVLAVPASAATGRGSFGAARHVVFVQTDNTSGNQVVAYHRAADGTLSFAGIFNTGGLGGQLTGSVTDHLASQGSLAYDSAHSLLYAVNAGSNTLTVFVARGDRLFRQQVISSGGRFPVSVAVHGNLVYVLNALNGGSVRGYRELAGRLFPIRGSKRRLHLDPTATPQFTNTPGQVAFSPDGSQVIVTTKANGNDVDVFGVRPDGRLTASPVVNSEAGTVPFAVTFDPAGNLAITEAGPGALATFTLNADGTITPIDTVNTGQVATCWVTPDGTALFTSNTGSSTLTRFTSAADGTLALIGQTATDPGTVDATVAPGGGFLYAQTGGNGIVDEFAVAGTTLMPIGSVTVPGAVGGEGIAAA
jgi:6-phosphogluconolactonase (cycloisomerase 2 family)